MVFIPSMYDKLGDGLSLAISFTNIIFMLVQSKPLLRVWHRLQTLARKIVHISEILHIDQKTREHPMPSPNFHHPHIYGPKSMYIPNLHCGCWGWNYTKDPSQLRSALLQAVLQNWGVNLGGRKHGRTMEPQNEYSFLLKDPFFCWGHLSDIYPSGTIEIMTSQLRHEASQGPFAMQLSMMWTFKKSNIWWLTKRPISQGSGSQEMNTCINYTHTHYIYIYI